jgi:hypothetical protein
MAKTKKEEPRRIPGDVMQIIKDIVTASEIRALDFASKATLETDYTFTPSIDAEPAVPFEDGLAGVLKSLLQSHVQDLKPYKIKSNGSPTSAQGAAAMKLIDHLDDPVYRGKGETLSLRCSQLDHYITAKVLDGSDVSDCHVQVTPYAWSTRTYKGISLDWLQSRLLTGLKAWLVFPPTVYNQRVYQRACGSGDLKTYRESCKNLRGGIQMLQQSGQTVRIPTFWPNISFTLHTACSVDCRYGLANNIPLHVRSVDTIRAGLQLLEDKKRSEKAEKWAHEIVEDICDVLRDNTEECTTSEQLMFRKDWVNLQRNIAVWIAGSSDTAWWDKALADIIEAWSCHSWDEAPNECQLCGKVLELDNGKPAFERAFEEHFRAVHWHVSVSEAAASIPAPSLIVEESEEAEGIRETSGLSGENMPEPVDHLPRTEDEDGIDATRTMVENLDSDEVVEHETDSKPKPGLEVMKSIHRKKEKVGLDMPRYRKTRQT